MLLIFSRHKGFIYRTLSPLVESIFHHLSLPQPNHLRPIIPPSYTLVYSQASLPLTQRWSKGFRSIATNSRGTIVIEIYRLAVKARILLGKEGNKKGAKLRRLLDKCAEKRQGTP